MLVAGWPPSLRWSMFQRSPTLKLDASATTTLFEPFEYPD